MDDKTTGVGNERGLGAERTSGRGDESISGRAPEGRPAQPATRVEDRMTGGASGTRTTAAPRVRDAAPEERTEEIRAEIEQTRGEMSETVNAIQERLRPRNIASNAAESVRHAASDKARDLADSEVVRGMRANPIPTAMIGVGIAGAAWMAFSRGESRPRPRDYMRRRDWRTAPGYREEDNYYRGFSGRSGYDTASTYTPGMAYDADRDYESGYNTAEYAGRRHETGELTEGMEDVRQRARRSAYRAQSQLQRTWNENPLLIAAASAVIGALVGLAIPETERENRMMGEARDNVVEGVQQMAKETAKKVQNAAATAATSAVGLTSDQPPSEQPQSEPGPANQKQPGKNPSSGRNS